MSAEDDSAKHDDDSANNDDDSANNDVVREAMERARALARRRGSTAARAPLSRRSIGDRSGAWPDDRDPQLFGAELERLVEDQGWAATMPTATVMGAWDRLVGAEVAAHCRPERLIDGELVLVAESTPWATQLQLLSRQLLARIGSEIGEGIVTRLRIHGPTTPNWSRGPRRVTGRGPRDTYG